MNAYDFKVKKMDGSEISLEDYEQQMNVNLRSTLGLMQKYIPEQSLPQHHQYM